MGYIDPDSGTHFYAPTDPLSATAISTVLNTAQTAEHNARLADRARIEQLESDTLQMHTITPSGFMTVQSTWEFQTGKTQIVRRIGPRVEFSLRLQKKSGAIIHGESVGFLKYEWRAVEGVEWQLIGQEAGGGQSAGTVAAALEADGDIIVLSPNGVSNILAVSGFYHMV